MAVARPKKDVGPTVDAFIMALAEAAKGTAKAKDGTPLVTFDQKIKVGAILVKYLSVKKGIPDDDQGSAWDEEIADAS